MSKINCNYVDVTLHELDALDFISHEQFVRSLPKLPSVVVSAIGSLGIQQDGEINSRKAIVLEMTLCVSIICISRGAWLYMAVLS